MTDLDRLDLRILAALQADGRLPNGLPCHHFPDAAKVNDILTTLKKEGYLASIHKKWFGTTPPETSSTVKALTFGKVLACLASTSALRGRSPCCAAISCASGDHSHFR